MTKIGVFDSGVGGLTVVREIERLLPHHPIVYFGDTARTPYGSKSRETLIRYAREDTRFLLDQGADIVVVACHSAASAATHVLRSDFSVPVFEVITPSINEAVAMTKKGVIGLIGTRATITSGIYETEIGRLAPGARVLSQACPLLVPLVEEGWISARETRMIVSRYLRPLKGKGMDTLVLGCTHYPLLKRIIQEKVGRRVQIVDPSAEVARAVRDHIASNGIGDAGETGGAESRFFLSDLTPSTQRIVESFLGRKVDIERVMLPCHTGP
ncbi:MAG: glutamate racemase [Deltaproteobacteria bacterium]